MINESFGDDLSHELVCIVDPLAAFETQREGKRRGEVGQVSGRAWPSGFSMPALMIAAGKLSG